MYGSLEVLSLRLFIECWWQMTWFTLKNVYGQYLPFSETSMCVPHRRESHTTGIISKLPNALTASELFKICKTSSTYIPAGAKCGETRNYCFLTGKWKKVPTIYTCLYSMFTSYSRSRWERKAVASSRCDEFNETCRCRMRWYAQ